MVAYLDSLVGCVEAALKESEAAAEMLVSLKAHRATVFAPDRGKADPEACRIGMEAHGGHWGPWVVI